MMFASLAADDYNAVQFCTASGNTSTVHRDAINCLVKDYKADGIWDLRIAIYPFIGTGANAQKYNLKDPRDLDLAYRLVFANGFSFTGGYAQPTTQSASPGSGSYANTFIPMNWNGGFGNMSLGFYSLTNSSAGTNYTFEIGARPSQSSNAGTIDMAIKHGSVASQASGATIGGDVFEGGASSLITNTAGWFLINRPSLSSQSFIRNKTVITSSTTTQANTAPNSKAILFFALYDQTGPLYTTLRPAGFGIVGYSVNTVQQGLEYDAIQRFSTREGRAQ